MGKLAITITGLIGAKIMIPDKRSSPTNTLLIDTS